MGASVHPLMEPPTQIPLSHTNASELHVNNTHTEPTQPHDPPKKKSLYHLTSNKLADGTFFKCFLISQRHTGENIHCAAPLTNIYIYIFIYLRRNMYMHKQQVSIPGPQGQHVYSRLVEVHVTTGRWGFSVRSTTICTVSILEPVEICYLFQIMKICYIFMSHIWV